MTDGERFTAYQTELAAMLVGGETIGQRFTEGYGFIHTVAKKNNVYHDGEQSH